MAIHYYHPQNILIDTDVIDKNLGLSIMRFSSFSN